MLLTWVVSENNVPWNGGQWEECFLKFVVRRGFPLLQTAKKFMGASGYSSEQRRYVHKGRSPPNLHTGTGCIEFCCLFFVKHTIIGFKQVGLRVQSTAL